MYLYNIEVRSETASADIKAAGSYPENSTKVINIGGYSNNRASQVVLMVKNPPANTGDARDAVLVPGVGKIPWRRKWLPTPVFSPGESHGQRSLMGFIPWGFKESDTTEQPGTEHIH